MKLHLADNLSLPIEAVTQTFAVVAKRGVGKTYTASVMAEEMLKRQQQIVVIDPTGAWFGLRSSADGKGPGFPIVVMGGDHGDLPLEEHAGEVIATAVVENRFSTVIDLSLFRKGQMIRFMVTFAETIYRLNREALHLFVDEADAVAPQGRQFGGEENRMLGAMEDIVRRGRKRGIGCTLITQRPAVINKNVLTQCESLFALRLTHPRDINAVTEWINVHADEKEAKEVLDSLPTLEVGEAWFWSPGWIQTIKRVKVRRRETFDSSATPKPGEKVKAPKNLADIDLDALGEKIKATVQRAKENDPRELRRRIAELEKQAKAAPVATKIETKVERVEVPVLKNGQLSRTEKIIERAEAIGEKMLAEVAELRRLVTPAAQAKEATRTPAKAIPRPAPVARLRQSIDPRSERQAEFTGHLPIGELKVLTACIQYPNGLRREQLTVITGYKRSSRDAYIQRLREKGFVAAQGDVILATGEGIAAIPDAEPLPTGEALRNYWMMKLPQGERAVLEHLIQAYPNPVERADLEESTGYKRSSRDAYLNRLAAKELVSSLGAGQVRASDELFAD